MGRSADCRRQTTSKMSDPECSMTAEPSLNNLEFIFMLLFIIPVNFVCRCNNNNLEAKLLNSGITDMVKDGRTGFK